MSSLRMVPERWGQRCRASSLDPRHGSVSPVSEFTFESIANRISLITSRYETPEANRETHRAGEAYQAFRAGVVAENLLAGYPDVRFWRPTGVGFLTSASVNLMGGESPSHGYIVVQDLSPLPDGKAQVLEALEPVAQAADKSTKVGSFWVLERENQEDGHELTVFSAFGSKSDYDEFVASEEAGGWKSIGDVCQTAITTTWKNSQIGFLGR